MYSRMSLVKEFDHFCPERGRNSHMFPKQNRCLLSHEGFAASVGTFELLPVGVLAKKSDV